MYKASLHMFDDVTLRYVKSVSFTHSQLCLLYLRIVIVCFLSSNFKCLKFVYYLCVGTMHSFMNFQNVQCLINAKRLVTTIYWLSYMLNNPI